MRTAKLAFAAVLALVVGCGPITNQGTLPGQRKSALIGGGYLPGGGGSGGGGGGGGSVTNVSGGSGINVANGTSTPVVTLNMSAAACAAHKGTTAIAADGSTLTCSYFVDTAGNGLSVTNNTATVVAQANKGLTVGASGVAIDTTTANATSALAFDGTNPLWIGCALNDEDNTDVWKDELRLKAGTASSVLQEGNATSAGTLAYTAGSDKHPGIARCTTTTGATNGCIFSTGLTSYSLSDTDITTITGVSSIDNLGTAVEQVTQIIGAGDSNTPTQTDGFGFMYVSPSSATTNGCAANTNWQIWVAKNGSRACVPLDGTNGTVASLVSVGSMALLTGVAAKFQASGNTSRLDFCIGNTDKDRYCHAANAAYSGQPISTGWVGCAAASGCALTNTNIPASGITASGSEWGVLWLHQKLAGTAVSVEGDLDYMRLCRPFSTR